MKKIYKHKKQHLKKRWYELITEKSEILKIWKENFRKFAIQITVQLQSKNSR